MLYYGWASGMDRNGAVLFTTTDTTEDPGNHCFHNLYPYNLLDSGCTTPAGKVLYLQRDLEHLAAELMRAVNVGAAEEFKHLLGKVSSIKRRWEGFLFWHFLLNGTGTIMYGLQEVFAFNHATVVMNAPMNWAGPLVAVFLLGQVACVARFNGQICLCLETTDNDTLPRTES